MAGTAVTAAASSSADPSSADDVSKEQLKRDPNFAANAVCCGLIVLRIFTNKELHPLVDSIEVAVAISGSNVDDACRKKMTEAIESIDHAEARSLIESLLPNKSSATAEVIPPSNAMGRRMLQLFRTAAEESKMSNLVLKFRIHNFENNFELGNQVFTMNDDCLDLEPIFLLCVQQPYLIHVSVEHQHLNHPPFSRMTHVAVCPEDGRRTELTNTIFYTLENRLEAIAMLDTRVCHSEKLQSVSPSYGGLNQKYVIVDLLIGVASVDEGQNQGIEMRLRFYCRMYPSNCRFPCRKMLQFVAKEWVKTPQWAKVLTREAAVSATVALGTVL